LRIDSKLLAEAESEDPTASRHDAAEALREIVATVGKPGQSGEQVRCVVSVQMLTEGWDANNVTHILGLRAFGSQLLCEQVVGRGLRRMDYTPDPQTGLLTEEYVDVYGIPFSIIPFKGHKKGIQTPEDKPKNHVYALPERKAFEIRFPIVENYVFALRSNLIKANVSAMPMLALEPDNTPTAIFVEPQVGYQLGTPKMLGGFEIKEHNRDVFYLSNHLQTIKFEIARRIIWALTEGTGDNEPKMRFMARHQLFPQVLRFVDDYVNRKVNFRGCHPCELALERYVKQIIERFLSAIEPDEAKGELPLLPILNRYKPIGTTSEVNFKTTRPCNPTIRSQINQVVADTKVFEQSAAFRLEQSKLVNFYARNDHLEFVIPYDYLGISHSYTPDFLVKLINGTTLILELKGWEDNQDRAKEQAAQRWVSAVNHWGKLGKWKFHVCRDPHLLGRELEFISDLKD
jgi:type III restriction enzyme